MRIALVLQRVDPSRGGAETYVADLARRLDAGGHRVDLVAESWDEGALPTSVRRVPVPVRSRSRWGRIWEFAQASEGLLRRKRPDCSVGFINTWGQDVLIPQGGVHAASLAANATRYPAGPRRELYKLGKRLNPKWWGLYRSIEARQFDPSRPTRFVAVSAMVRGHLERYHGVPADRVRVIPNAIDADRLQVADPTATRADLRRGLGLNDSDLLGLFVGHNFRLKGLPSLLRALRVRRGREPEGRPIHVVVCGGGRLAPLRKMVAALDLASVVHLAGFVPDVRPYYQGADFFVSPTYYDPCSLVVFEALACGLPVITTRCNGAGEVMVEGRDGFVIDHPDDQAALIRALDAMTDAAARRAMSTSARRLGAEQSLDRHVARLIDLFEEVAASRSRNGARVSTSLPSWS